jgi:rhodanese-related sulfurtransferase/ABC-type phosphate/phosphonate transport system substrate-binding protein
MNRCIPTCSRRPSGSAARAAALLFSALASSTALAATSVLINPGDAGERSRFETFAALKAVVEPALQSDKLGAATVSMSHDATADLAATRSRIPDVFVAPAHVVGSAVRYGYVPLLTLDKPVQAVLVARKDSPATDLASAKGLRLGLPKQDSIVTYLMRGEVNAANTTLKRHFKLAFESRYQDALLVCLQIRQCDVVAAERSLYDRWVAAGEPVKAVLESKPVPGIGVAVKPGTPLAAAAPELAKTLLSGFAAAPEAGGKGVPVQANAFDYVATLGYFTPRSLPGATQVDAAAVAQLLKAKAVYVDTRSEAEFKAGHVPGALFVPYIEKSAKEADFDASKDQFELAKLPADRNAPLVFACNGPECWKSFKASQAALKAGYTKVHWFRGGFPEWRAAGLPLDKDS